MLATDGVRFLNVELTVICQLVYSIPRDVWIAPDYIAQELPDNGELLVNFVGNLLTSLVKSCRHTAPVPTVQRDCMRVEFLVGPVLGFRGVRLRRHGRHKSAKGSRRVGENGG